MTVATRPHTPVRRAGDWEEFPPRYAATAEILSPLSVWPAVLLKSESSGGTRDMKRECGVINAGNILHRTGESQNFAVHLDRPRLLLRRRSNCLVRHQQDFRAKERSRIVEFDALKALPALCDQVQASVGIFLRDGHDFRRAPDPGDSFIRGADYAKSARLARHSPIISLYRGSKMCSGSGVSTGAIRGRAGTAEVAARNLQLARTPAGEPHGTYRQGHASGPAHGFCAMVPHPS